jgi:hypothetical protein
MDTKRFLKFTPAFVLAIAFAGFTTIGTASAQSSSTMKASHGVSQYHGIRHGKAARVKNGATGMSHRSTASMNQHTNQQTGAAGSTQSLSKQKGNQAKTAPKTQ